MDYMFAEEQELGPTQTLWEQRAGKELLVNSPMEVAKEFTSLCDCLCFYPLLYLLILSVKLNLGLIDVQGLFIVAHRQILKGVIFPGPEYKLVASVCAMGLIKPDLMAIHLEGEGIHELQQLRRK